MFSTTALMLAWIGPALAVDEQTINSTIDEFNSHSVFDIPTLSDAQRSQLANGSVVRLLNPVRGGNYQVVGLLAIPLPQQQVWVAGQDPHFASTAATEHRMSIEGDRATWYGFLDLPMGFSDRHWVVDVWNNHAMASATNNRMWEHPWRLNEQDLPQARTAVNNGQVGGLTVEAFDRAIFTPNNEGALAFVELSPNETLLIYHATSAVGGNVPERLMAEFAKATLEGYLRKIEKNAMDVVPGHYTAGHGTIPGGDGAPVPLF